MAEAFRRDMDTLLRPGLPKFDVDEATELDLQPIAYYRFLSILNLKCPQECHPPQADVSELRWISVQDVGVAAWKNADAPGRKMVLDS